MPPVTLYTPNLAPAFPFLSLPTDGRDCGAEVTSFLKWCKGQRRSEAKLAEGEWMCRTGIVPPQSGMRVIGSGRAPATGYPEGYGTVLRKPDNSVFDLVTMAGTASPDGGSTGMVKDVTLENLMLWGQAGFTNAQVPGGVGALLVWRNTYQCKLNAVTFGGWNTVHFYNEGSWDYRITEPVDVGGGWSDPSVTPASDSTTIARLMAATKRAKWLSTELKIGRSLGRGAWEIVSPNAIPGNDVARDGVVIGGRFESGPNASSAVLAYGWNGCNVRWIGNKFELPETPAPLIALEGMNDWSFESGWLAGANKGASTWPLMDGSPAGTAWAKYRSPGLLVAVNCTDLTFDRMGTSLLDAAPGSFNAIVALHDCPNARGRFGISSGLTAIAPGGAWVVARGCDGSQLVGFAEDFLLNWPGANRTPLA